MGTVLVSKFQQEVERVYGEDAAGRFMHEAGGAKDLTYTEALEATDRALLGSSRPIISGFHRTVSLPAPQVVTEKDKAKLQEFIAHMAAQSDVKPGMQ